MNKIQELRKERKMTQEELASILNVKRSAISKYEAEKIPLTTDAAIALANIFNVSLDFLLGRTDINRGTRKPDIKSDNLLGNRVQVARLDLGLSQKELSDKLYSMHSNMGYNAFISEKELNEIECGLHTQTISEHSLKNLADILEVSVDYLTGASDEKELKPLPRETFGNRLKRLRKTTNRTKYDVAYAVGATLFEVDRWENGEVEMDKNMRRCFCELYGVPPSILRQKFSRSSRPGMSSKEEQPQILDEETSNVLLSIEHLFLALNTDGRTELLEYAQDIASAPKFRSIKDD